MCLKKYRIVQFVVVITVAAGWSCMSARGAEVPSAGGGVDLEGVQVACGSDQDCQSSYGSVSFCSSTGGGGTCYVPASRYLAISPNLGNGITARRISLDIDGDGAFDPVVDHVLGWVDQPFATLVAGTEPSPQAQARISAVSIYRNWNDLTDVHSSFIGAVSVKVGDCEITPKGSAAQGAVSGNVYFIQAISQGSPEGDESSYSVPLRLRTTARHGDSVGTGLGGNYPNNGASMLDVFADVLGFMGAQQIPKWRLEMSGNGVPGSDNVPNFGNVSMVDIFIVVIAFQTGGEYPFSQPCDCAGQNCP